MPQEFGNGPVFYGVWQIDIVGQVKYRTPSLLEFARHWKWNRSFVLHIRMRLQTMAGRTIAEQMSAKEPHCLVTSKQEGNDGFRRAPVFPSVTIADQLSSRLGSGRGTASASGHARASSAK